MLWRELEIFRALMSAGSAAKAAVLMDITQPAVSQSLKKLEAAAGFALFNRLRGRLHPTPEAHALLVEVERSFAGLGSIEHRMRSLRRFGVNTLSLASYPAFGLGFIPRALARLLGPDLQNDERPQVSLQVLSSREVGERVLAGRADFGLMADEFPTIGLEHSTFASLKGVAVLPPGHPLARAAVLQPSQLAHEPFLALNPEDASRRRLERILAEHGVQLNVVAEMPYAANVCEMAMNGLGIGVVNPITALDYGRKGLSIRPLAVDVPFVCLLVMTPGHQLSALAKRCLRAMREQLAVDQAALKLVSRSPAPASGSGRSRPLV